MFVIGFVELYVQLSTRGFLLVCSSGSMKLVTPRKLGRKCFFLGLQCDLIVLKGAPSEYFDVYGEGSSTVHSR